jgi:hypothetical protein
MAIPAGRLKRGDILRSALQRAGNTKLMVAPAGQPALARVKLNRILEGLYNEHDWPFLWTEAPVSVGAQFTLPADFLQSRDDWGLSYVRSDGMRRGVAEVDRYTFDTRGRNLRATCEDPLIWTADRARGIGRVWPTPLTALQATLHYKFLPADVDPLDPVTYDADVPLFPWHDYLIDALYQWALDYEQDPRALGFAQLNAARLAQIRGTALPPRSRERTLPLDPQVFDQGPRRTDWGWGW